MIVIVVKYHPSWRKFSYHPAHSIIPILFSSEQRSNSPPFAFLPQPFPFYFMPYVSSLLDVQYSTKAPYEQSQRSISAEC
jgi:hypothetical protein